MSVCEEETLSQALEKETREKRGGSEEEVSGGAGLRGQTGRGEDASERWKERRKKAPKKKKRGKEGMNSGGVGVGGGGGLHPCVVLAASQQLLMKHFGSILDSVAHSVISFVPNNPPLIRMRCIAHEPLELASQMGRQRNIYIQRIGVCGVAKACTASPARVRYEKTAVHKDV